MTMNGDTMRRLRCVLGLVIFFTLGATSWAQLSEAQRWAAEVENAYEVEPNVTYLVANNYELSSMSTIRRERRPLCRWS